MDRGAPRVTECPSEASVLDHVQGQLTRRMNVAVAGHVAECAACRDLVAWLSGQVGARTSPARAHNGATIDGRAVDGSTVDARLFAGALSSGDQALAGRLLAGKYKLGQRLGAGGMGVVFEAVNTWTERRVAVKLLHPHFSADPEVVARFRLEAKNAARVQHPSVVEVLDLGQDPTDGALYMVQQFLSGQTLRQRLVATPRLTVAEAAAVLVPIMDGLVAAHDAGVVHRDVKPENIILASDHAGQARPKLIDFGISKIVAGEIAALIQTGRALGTPLYMSPEQLRARDIDGRADVWAMGVVLFEVLAGRRPFEGATGGEVAANILTTEAPALQTIAPSVPDDVTAVVARALERDVGARFPSMRAMLEALLACPAASSALSTMAPPPALAKAVPPRRAWMSLAAVGGALATVALAAWALAGARHGGSANPAVPFAAGTATRTQPKSPPSSPASMAPGTTVAGAPTHPEPAVGVLAVEGRPAPAGAVAPAAQVRHRGTPREAANAAARPRPDRAPRPAAGPDAPAKWAPMLDL